MLKLVLFFSENDDRDVKSTETVTSKIMKTFIQAHTCNAYVILYKVNHVCLKAMENIRV